MSRDGGQGLHVAIVGAGIAGLALGIGLHKHGIPFTLYEEASCYSVVGAGIGFGPNGLLAMDLLEEGFRPKYEAVCVGNKSPEDESVFFEALLCRNGLGLREDWHGRSSWGSANYRRKSAHRRELLEILTGFIPQGRVKFDKRLTDIVQGDNQVTMRFADGEVDHASMLVGADGIESIVREHVLLPQYEDEVRPKYADSYCYRAVIPMADARGILGDLTDTAKMYLGQDRCVVTYRVSGGAEFNFLHCVFEPGKPWRRPGTLTEKVTYQTMCADFADRNIDRRLIELLKKAPPVRWGLFHHPKTSTYYRGHVVLIGDSAHASLPYQAAGAGQGVEDALILATVLSAIDHSSPGTDQVHAAFQAYDAVRRPRAQRQTEQSMDASALISFQDVEAGSDMEAILQRMHHDRFDWLWFHDLSSDIELARDKLREMLR